MTLPNFLIIGAAKSGTTALYQTLKQHPDVFMSEIKEPHFFVFYGAASPPCQGPGDDKELANKIYLQFIIPSTVRQKIKAQLLLWNSRKPPPLDPEIWCRLTQEFREDILKLQDLIHRDLSHWLAQ